MRDPDPTAAIIAHLISTKTSNEIELLFSSRGPSISVRRIYAPKVREEIIRRAIWALQPTQISSLIAELGLDIDSARLKPKDVSPIFKWPEKKYRIFISHSTTDRTIATSLGEALLRRSCAVFIAHETIAATKEWQIEIEGAIHTCDFAIAIASPRLHRSVWCNQEIGMLYAIKTPMLSIAAGGKPSGFLAKFQSLELTNDCEKTCDSIMSCIAQDNSARLRFIRRLVSREKKSKVSIEARDVLKLALDFERTEFGNDRIGDICLPDKPK